MVKCHSAECQSTKCRLTIDTFWPSLLNAFVPSVNLLNVIIRIASTLNVVAPSKRLAQIEIEKKNIRVKTKL